MRQETSASPRGFVQCETAQPSCGIRPASPGSWAGWEVYLGVPHCRDGVVVQAVGHQLQLRRHHNQALESFQQILQRLSNHLQEAVVPTEKKLMFLRRDQSDLVQGLQNPM